VVFDFETYGLDEVSSEAIQVAGKAYDPRTLEPVPVSAGGEFCSMMRPLYPERLDTPGAKKALEVNKKTVEECLAAPDQKLVWNEFVAWVNKWNVTRNKFGAPLACGKNIRNFDLKFARVLNELHCKGDKTLLFYEREQRDLEDLIGTWFEDDQELPDMKMDTLRTYFGLSSEGAHDALVDVRQTGVLIMGFIRAQRELRRRTLADGSPLIKLKGAYAGRGI
jgi:hypothetical protein